MISRYLSTLLFTLAALGCGDDSNATMGTGGITATGGTTGTGGDAQTGGVSSTGGASATGGVTSTGGVNNTGGASSAGGASDTGGSANVDEVVCDGDFTIVTEADLAAIAACTTINGTLSIETTEVTDLALPALTAVGGNVTIGQLTSLTSASFPALTSIGGSVYLTVNKNLTKLSFPVLASCDALSLRNTGSLTTLELPLLESAPGGIGISYIGIQSLSNSAITKLAALKIDTCPALETIQLTALTTVEDYIVIDSDPLLTVLELPKLAAVGSFFSIVSDRSLQTLSLPKLTDVTTGYFRVAGADDLTTLALPELKHAGALTFGSNPSATIIDAPNLESVDSSLEIADNALLQSLVFPKLTSCDGPLTFMDNPALPTCAAQALVDQIIDETQPVTLAGNDDSATCP